MTKDHQPTIAQERDYTAMLLRQLRHSGMEVRLATDGELTRVMSLQNPRRAVNLLQMSDSTIYGWFDAVGIHITEAGLNPNTLAHEYTHGFMAMLSLDNKPLYDRIVKDLKESPVWQEVLEDEGYTGIAKDETRLASEVASRIVGNENELRASEGISAKVLRAIQDFWDYVQEKLGIDKDKRLTPRRITNMVMKDIVSLGDRNNRLTGAVDEIAIQRINQEKVNAIPRVLYKILEKEYGKEAAEELSTKINAKVTVFMGTAESSPVLLSPIVEDLKRIAQIVGVSDDLPNDELDYQCQIKIESLFDESLHRMDISPYFQSELMVEIGDWREDYEREEITKFAKYCDNAQALLQSSGYKQSTGSSMAWGEYSYSRSEEDGFSFHFKSNSKEPVELFADYDEDYGQAMFEIKPIGESYSKEIDADRWLSLLEQQVKMKQEEIKDMADNKKQFKGDGRSAEDRALEVFANALIEKIETLQSDWKKPWFTPQSAQQPRNLSGRPYNGMNSVILMLMQEKNGWQTSRYATFDRITGMNYQKDKQGVRTPAVDKEGNKLPLVSINKGEKSTPVMLTTFTVVDPETKEKVSYDDYKQMTEEQRSKYNVYPKLQVYNVFNLDQTNLKESRPEMYQAYLDETEGRKFESAEGMTNFAAVDAMIEKDLWVCPIKPKLGDDAYYSISKDEIIIPEKKQFQSGESFYSNLFHEMAHSTGSEKRLNRLKPASFGSSEYAKEELVAEITAALLSSQYGMSKHVKEDSCAYLKSWLDSLHENPDFIKSTLVDVKRASSFIGQRVDAVNLRLERDGVEADFSDIRQQNKENSVAFTKENNVRTQENTSEQQEVKQTERVEEVAARETVQTRMHR